LIEDRVLSECQSTCERLKDYHPLLISFANTKEVLAIINRSGNVHSAEDAAGHLDKSIDICTKAGFRRIRMRGDCKFSQTQHLDRWNEQGVKFNFGYENRANLKALAEDLPESAWKPLKRSQRTIKTTERAKPVNVKRQMIRQRGYVHLELEHEDVAEFEYKPTACHRGYRMVVVRKNISKEQGEAVLFDEIRYLFYISNDDKSVTSEQIVFSCNKRCDQENLIAQLKSGVRSLCAPTDNLFSNGAYMLMTSLAWTLTSSWKQLDTRAADPDIFGKPLPNRNPTTEATTNALQTTRSTRRAKPRMTPYAQIYFPTLLKCSLV
jgi:hypothetical protein